MLSDRFTKHSIQESKGSTNPYINFPDIAKFEFALPPLDQQRRIAEILWAVGPVSERFREASQHAQAALKRQLDQVFSSSGNFPLTPLENLTTKIVDGVHKTPAYVSSGVPFIVVENLTCDRGIDFSNTRFVTEEDHRQFYRRANPERGDVLVSKDGTLGVTRYIDTDRPFSIFVSVALLKPKHGVLDGRFLSHYMHSELFWQHVRRTSTGSAIKHIVLRDFKSAPFPVMPISTQRHFAEQLGQTSRMAEELLAHIANSEVVLRSLINAML